MDSLIHADVFFFITGVAVIVFASACAVLVVYLILIVRDVKQVSKLIRNQVQAIHDDVERIRDSFQSRSVSFLDLIGLFKRNRTTGKKKVAPTKE